jgi:hypothetical protein
MIGRWLLRMTDGTMHKNTFAEIFIDIPITLELQMELKIHTIAYSNCSIWTHQSQCIILHRYLRKNNVKCIMAEKEIKLDGTKRNFG